MPEPPNADKSNHGGLRSLVSLKSRRSGTSDKSEKRRVYSTPTTAELYKEQGIPLTKEKCKACVIGALVADSAAVNLDRVSSSVFQSLVGLPEFDSCPEFFSASSDPDAISQSRLSLYGNENLPLLQSLVTHGGLDGLHFTNTSFEFLKQYSGKKSHLAQKFLLAMERGVYFPAGVQYNSMACLVKVPLLVARYAGKEELVLKLKDAVRAHQNTTDAVALGIAAARILERVVLGASVVEALTWSQSPGVLDSTSQKQVQTVLQSISIPHSVFVAKMGRSDKLPGAFLSSLHAAAISCSYQDAVRTTIKAGGSGMCGRASLAGAFMAAEAGPESVPEQWKARVAKFTDYEDLTNKLIGQRAIITILPP